MYKLNENERRNVISEFYRQHQTNKKSYTVNHFYQMGIPKRTIYDICRRVETKIRANKVKAQAELQERCQKGNVKH